MPAEPCAIEAPCKLGIEIDPLAGEECPHSSLVEVGCDYWDYPGEVDYSSELLSYCMTEDQLLDYVAQCADDDVPCGVRQLGEQYGGRYRASCGLPEATCG